MPRLHMQVCQPGTERKVCIKVFLCCQGHAIETDTRDRNGTVYEADRNPP